MKSHEDQLSGETLRWRYKGHYRSSGGGAFGPIQIGLKARFGKYAKSVRENFILTMTIVNPDHQLKVTRDQTAKACREFMKNVLPAR